MNRLFALVVLPLAGCPVSEDWRLQSYVDEGEVCVTGGGGTAEFLVTVQECMSSSCSRAFAGSCEATFDGAAVTLTSDLSWEDDFTPGAECTDDCGIPSTTCTIADLPDGTWDVAFGGQTLTITLPATEPCSPFGS
ncbi:MAG: hypothetical protein ABMA64_34130 [Myxococcota bacterium]